MGRPRIHDAAPLSDAEKLARSRENLERAGGRRVTVNLSPDAAAALSALVKRDYGENATAAINRALVAAISTS